MTGPYVPNLWTMLTMKRHLIVVAYKQTGARIVIEVLQGVSGLFLLTYKLVHVREVAWRFCGLERAVFQVK